MIGNVLSPTHLLLILAVALIVLGPRRLPEAGRGLGSAIRGFKESLSADQRPGEDPAVEKSHELDETAVPRAVEQRTGTERAAARPPL
jgi:sec-independent protein translocase protein TatA